MPYGKGKKDKGYKKPNSAKMKGGAKSGSKHVIKKGYGSSKLKK